MIWCPYPPVTEWLLCFSGPRNSPLDVPSRLLVHLETTPFCQVRMGVHSGPVFLIQDINGARNVSGAGINQAERVMSCGGAGHILLSELVADPLRQLSRWKNRLHDAGVCRVKDGTMHLSSLDDAEIGNADPPHRLVRHRWPRKVLISAAALVVIAGGALWVVMHRSSDEIQHAEPVEHRVQQSAASLSHPPKIAAALGDSFVGITLWRMRSGP